MEGFLNVDLDKETNPDINCDIRNLEGIKDGSVDEIYASHCLEHIPHTETLKTLKEWSRVLKKRGIAWVSVPDFGFCVDFYRKNGLTDWLVRLVWGDQVAPLAFHYVLFDFNLLSRHCADAGFSSIDRVSTLPYEGKDCSDLRDNIEGNLISLNIKAVK